MVPANFIRVFSADQITTSVKKLGVEVSTWVKQVHVSTGQQPLAVCILRGATFFFADLLRSIEASVEPTFCRTWSYSSVVNKQLSSSSVRVSVEDVIAEGRAILMVDDICDTGSTLLKLHNVFKDLGASEVKSAVLIHRIVSETKFQPTWSAFDYPGKEWFVGYGMEDRNHFSNLPDIYKIVTG